MATLKSLTFSYRSSCPYFSEPAWEEADRDFPCADGVFFVFFLGEGQKLDDKAECHSQRAIRSLINEHPVGWREMLEREM